MNPLTALHSLATTQNALNANLQFQQQFEARKAIGPILQQAIDPESGSLDYNKAFMLMAQDPRTAFIANDFLNGAVQRQFTQAQTAKAVLETAVERNKTIAGATASLLALGRTPVLGPDGQVTGQAANAKPEDLMRVLTSPEMSRIISPKDAVALVMQYGSMTPAQRHDLLVQKQAQAMTANEAAANVLGKIEMQKLGGVTTPVAVVPSRGTAMPVPGASLGEQPTVEQLNVPRPGLDARGRETTVPAAASPMAVPGPGGPVIQQPPGAPPAAVSPGASLPPADVRVGAPLATDKDQSRVGAAPAAPAAPAGLQSRTTKLDPHSEEALKELATKYEPQLNERVQNANLLRAILGEAAELKKNFTPGGGAAVRAKLAQTLQALGVPAEQVDKVAGGSIDSVQAFDKLMVQSATLAMGTLFRGTRWTQQEWLRMQDANPNLNTSPGALTKMFRFIDRIATMTQHEQQAWADYRSDDKNDLLRWEARWNKFAQEQLAKQKGHL
jgi:hypothetical protein